MINIKDTQLNNLADSLISKIKEKEDFFATSIVVCPNFLLQQWFRSYWLRSQGENVLMNVEFKLLNDVLPLLVEQENYQLIRYNDLKKIILKILAEDEEIIPADQRQYYKDSPIRMDDFASVLTSLYLDYYKDDFEGLNGWEESFQSSLYRKIVEMCPQYKFGTIERPEPKKSYDGEMIYFFGFSRFDKVYRNLLEKCDFVSVYELEEDEDYNKEYSITGAPSKLREIEHIHSDICKKLQAGARMSDFVVVAPSIKEYASTIEQVFRQNDTEYPDIPFVLRYSEKSDSNLSAALKILFRIEKNGFFTRLDLYQLIANPLVQRVRNISNEEVFVWTEMIISLNIRRDYEYRKEWDYLKKRLLLSKLSSINFSDNLVTINKDADYLPYSKIGVDDSDIHKLVGVIDDLNSFIDLLKGKEIADDELIDKLKMEFDKWFSLCDGEIEKNKLYRKVIGSLENIKTMKIEKLSPASVFYLLFEDSAVHTVQSGDAFTGAISFVDFGINNVVSADHTYFIGASSANIPVPVVRSELDLREKTDENNDRLTLNLLYQNAVKDLSVSYVDLNLKSHEEYFLSSIVTDLCKRTGWYLDKDRNFDDRKINKVPLDESRDYADLFTRREFNDKEYYLGLLQEAPSTGDQPDGKGHPSQNIFYESVWIKDMEAFLNDPLQYKALRLFGKDEDNQSDIEEEWEQFTPNNLQTAAIFKKIIVEQMKESDRYDSEEARSSLRLKNLLPAINEEYEKFNFDTINVQCTALYDGINTMIRNIIENKIKTEYGDDADVDTYLNNYDIDRRLIESQDLKMLSEDNREWTLSSGDDVYLFAIDNERFYFELKKPAKSDNREIAESKFIRIYLNSLIDIAKLDTSEEVYVILYKYEKYGEGEASLVEKEFSITPSDARALLNKIHKAMGDYEVNRLLPIDLRKDVEDENIKTFNNLKDKLYGEHGLWTYFDHKNLFDPETDLGYDPEKFDVKKFKDALNDQSKFIMYLEELKEEKEDQKNDSDSDC